MTLWKSETNLRDDGAIFFHGLGDAMAFMVFDNEINKVILLLKPKGRQKILPLLEMQFAKLSKAYRKR